MTKPTTSNTIARPLQPPCKPPRLKANETEKSNRLKYDRGPTAISMQAIAARQMQRGDPINSKKARAHRTQCKPTRKQRERGNPIHSNTIVPQPQIQCKRPRLKANETENQINCNTMRARQPKYSAAANDTATQCCWKRVARVQATCVAQPHTTMQHSHSRRVAGRTRQAQRSNKR